MATIKKMGSLFPDGNPEPVGIPYFEGQLSIGDTVAGCEISWVAVNGLLIADRCVCVNICWNQLNEMHLGCGKLVAIDDKRYFCRCLKVGDQKGIPNEWDSALDTTSEDDELWHWKGSSFYGLESVGYRYKGQVCRGGSMARSWINAQRYIRRMDFGYRPVLELLPPEPIITEGLLGTHLKVFGQDDSIATGVLEDYTDYDLILRIPHPEMQEVMPGTTWIDSGLLAIDRMAIEYLVAIN